jgi:hypothetical protein
MNNPDWIDDLLKEKSLVDVSRISRKFSHSKFDFIIRRTYLIGSPILVGLSLAAFMNPNQEALMVKSLASNLVTYSTTVLGFLIAGLAVFTTLSEKKIWIELAQTQVPGEGVSAFKYLFFNMLSVFIIFLSCVVLSVITSVIAAAEVQVGVISISGWQLESASWINAIALTSLSMLFFESAIRLKSFIWNIYSTFISMLTVKWLLEKDGEQGQSR